MNTVIICARNSSTRLPGKALVTLCGKPVLLHLIERYRATSRVDRVIVAVPKGEADIVAECEKWEVPCFEGSLDDVVGRMDAAMKRHAPQTKYIFRGLGDMLLFDVELLNWRFDLLRRSNRDLTWCGLRGDPLPVYGSRESPWSRFAWDYIVKNSQGDDREHAGQWLYRKMREFKVEYTSPLQDEYYLPARLELDTPNDLVFFEQVYNHLYAGPGTPSTLHVLRWLQLHPEIAAINAEIETKTLTRVSWQKRGAAWACSECGAEPLQTLSIEKRKGVNSLETECPRCGKIRRFMEIPPFLAGRRYG